MHHYFKKKSSIGQADKIYSTVYKRLQTRFYHSTFPLNSSKIPSNLALSLYSPILYYSSFVLFSIPVIFTQWPHSHHFLQWGFNYYVCWDIRKTWLVKTCAKTTVRTKKNEAAERFQIIVLNQSKRMWRGFRGVSEEF